MPNMNRFCCNYCGKVNFLAEKYFCLRCGSDETRRTAIVENVLPQVTESVNFSHEFTRSTRTVSTQTIDEDFPAGKGLGQSSQNVSSSNVLFGTHETESRSFVDDPAVPGPSHLYNRQQLKFESRSQFKDPPVEKKYQKLLCWVCQKGFKEHTGDGCYKCCQCDYSSTQFFNLVMHSNTHTP